MSQFICTFITLCFAFFGSSACSRGIHVLYAGQSVAQSNEQQVCWARRPKFDPRQELSHLPDKNIGICFLYITYNCTMFNRQWFILSWSPHIWHRYFSTVKPKLFSALPLSVICGTLVQYLVTSNCDDLCIFLIICLNEYLLLIRHIDHKLTQTMTLQHQMSRHCGPVAHLG